MTVLRNILFVAVLAGLAAGITMTALQVFATVPLILEAETLESAGASDALAQVPGDHDHADGAGSHDHAQVAGGHDHAAAMTPAPAPAGQGHDHGEGEWAPADGFQRMSLTLVANLVTAIGFGLLLVAASEAAGGIGSLRQGVLWGLAGFVVFTLAPGLGLPPELPAMPAADLGARQVWWLATVALTAAGLGLVAFGRSGTLALLGAALLVVPHLIPAPQPASFESPIPGALHHSFVVAVTLTNLVFWVLLGATVGLMRPRFASGLAGPRPQLA